MNNAWYPITDKERVSIYSAGYKPGYIEKAMTLGIKNIILCMEDGTPEDKKNEARCLVKRALDEFKDSDKNLIVRINSVYTEHWQKDIEAIMENKPARIRIPMVNKPEDLALVDAYIEKLLKETNDDRKPLYEIMIESREGLNNIKKIYESCSNIYAFTLGGCDYYDDVKDICQNPEQEVINAKKRICEFCKENKLYSFDTTYMNYRNMEGFKNDCIFSRNLGFSGRSVIHPDQIKMAIEIYSDREGNYV